MTIKEMEFYSGLTRANIRYYESEGLLSPHRNENGYRDYSEQDLNTLLKVKLLRALHISLVEIKQIQSRERQLEDVLKTQISSLEREKEEIIHSQNICKKMRDDHITYDNLNPNYYLSVMKDSGNLISEFKTDTYLKIREPWRRYFARSLDLSIYSAIGFLIILTVFRVNISNFTIWATVISILVSLILTLLIEPILLSKFGTTIGKAILGIYVTDFQKKNLSYHVALDRTIGVLKHGLGFLVPFYEAYCLWDSYFKLENKRIDLAWEDESVIVLRDKKWWRILGFIGANLMVCGLLIIGVFVSQMPKNRGNLTVAEFCENYNQYAAYYGDDDRLQKDGTWIEYETNNGRFEFASGRPDFEYIEENGELKEVKFVISMKNGEKIITDCQDKINYVTLAFLKSQKDIGLFSREVEKVLEKMSVESVSDFESTLHNISILRKVDYGGYDYFSLLGELWASEDECYFSMEFVIRKL